MAKRSLVPVERIEGAILVLRGHKVIPDKDLAALYGVTTGNLNKAVNRNVDRFPDDFMLQLTEEEFSDLKFHFGTSRWGGTRKLPRAFTEQGVAMLSRASQLSRSAREHRDYAGLRPSPCADCHESGACTTARRVGEEIRRPIQGRLRCHPAAHGPAS